MFTERFLCHRRGALLSQDERAELEASISHVFTVDPRTTIVRAGEPVSHSTLLVDGLMGRYIDDRQGRRQFVALHVPGDFVDLHAYPLKQLDHEVAALTGATVATVEHDRLDRIVAARPDLARKLWYATLLDGAMHRAWLFRLGRLDAAGRVAHFLCETNLRLAAVGLSDGHRFALGLTQTHLSEILGLTSVHINRVMRALREARIVSFRSSTVEIHDPEALARRGEFNPAYLYIDADDVLGVERYAA